MTSRTALNRALLTSKTETAEARRKEERELAETKKKRKREEEDETKAQAQVARQGGSRRTRERREADAEKTIAVGTVAAQKSLAGLPFNKVLLDQSHEEQGEGSNTAATAARQDGHEEQGEGSNAAATAARQDGHEEQGEGSNAAATAARQACDAVGQESEAAVVENKMTTLGNDLQVLAERVGEEGGSSREFRVPETFEEFSQGLNALASVVVKLKSVTVLAKENLAAYLLTKVGSRCDHLFSGSPLSRTGMSPMRMMQKRIAAGLNASNAYVEEHLWESIKMEKMRPAVGTNDEFCERYVEVFAALDKCDPGLDFKEDDWNQDWMLKNMQKRVEDALQLADGKTWHFFVPTCGKAKNEQNPPPQWPSIIASMRLAISTERQRRETGLRNEKEGKGPYYPPSDEARLAFFL
jgi:hypothetical protein